MQGSASSGLPQREGQTAVNHPAASHRAGGRAPVFLYSGFRASSTWFWSKFRAHDDLLCYYEPFNEQLAGLTLDNIAQARPDSWRSHHPGGAPYVLEYAGVLGESGGVTGFPAAQDQGERYIGAAGPEGPLDEDVAAYVQGLIDHAHERGRVPLLACTRLLGRARGLKTAFGGYHILLIRNLFHQWNSYAGQARFGNWYFLQTLYETLGLGEHDATIAYLAKFFPEETRSSLEAWVAPGNFDRVFCYFVGFHLYFLTLARRAADLVVNANALAGPDPDYRDAIVASIASNIGIELDLKDASERVDFPLYPIADRQACMILIDEIAASVKTSCGADAQEQGFIDDLVADIWSEQALFQRQTAGAVEYLAQIDAENETKLREAQRESDEQARKFSEQREADAQALDALRRELAHNAQESASKFADAHADLVEREAALAAAQAQLAQDRDAAGQLAMARDARRQAEEELILVRAEMNAAQHRSAQREADFAAVSAQTSSLRAALIASEADATQARARIVQLESSIVNVDAANIDLADRLLHADRVCRELEECLAGEQAGREQLQGRIEHILDDPGARHRLRAVLDLLAARRLSWALLPERVWRRKLGESLAAMPGFEGPIEGMERDAPPDRLAHSLWIALISTP